MAAPVDDEADDDQASALSSLPDGYTGLVIGLASITAITWSCAAALFTGTDPRATVLLVIAGLLLLLIGPTAVRSRRRALPRVAVALQYGGFAALTLLAWATLLWAPGLTWAAMAAAVVLQGGYTAGVGLVALQERAKGADRG